MTNAIDNVEVPEGWAKCFLADVVVPSKAKIEPSENVEARYLSLEHIESNTGAIVGYGTGADVNSTKAVFSRGDVLYGRLRPYLNKVCIPDFDGICSTDILVFSKSRYLESCYLMRFLMQQEIVQYANHHSSGVQLPRVAFAKLAEIEFHLPALAEQKRIVAKVEELLGRVNAARERLAKVPALVKRFRQSVLAAACSGQLTADWRERKGEYANENSNGEIPSSWRWQTIGDHFRVDSGDAFKKKDYSNEGLRLLQIANVGFGRILWDQEHFLPEEFAATHKDLLLRAGEVVIALNRPILGDRFKVARITDCDLPAILYQRVGRLRPKGSLDANFAFVYFQSPRMFAEVSDRLQGSDQPYLNTSLVPGIPLVAPLLPEQHEIVRRVDALFALADKIEARLKSATARVEKITQAILAKAFRGELVPTEAELARLENRSYEPAAALLARIRAERETAAAESVDRKKTKTDTPKKLQTNSRKKSSRQ